MALFGVPRLDDSMASNPEGRPILLENRPGVEAQPFLLQATRTSLREERHVVYITTDRGPDQIRRHLGDAPLERLRILDAFSSLHGIHEPDSILITEPGNPQELIAHIEQAHRSRPDATLILDNLTGLAMRAGSDRLAAAGTALYEAMARFPHALALYTRWHEDALLEGLLKRFETRVYLESVEDRIITNHYFRVEAIDGKAARDPERVLYRVDGGDVRIYIPKIVVTGPGDAGKSTFVHAVSDHAVSADRKGSTVAMDRGAIDRGGMRVEIFGTPGQERFDPIVAPILKQAVGLVLIVDSSQPGSFARARSMFEMGWRQGLHAVVVANKQDLDDAMAPEEVAKALELPEDIPVIACSAIDEHAARDALDNLLHRILTPPEVTV